MKDIEAKVGAFVLVCAVVLCGTVYYVSTAKFKGAHVHFRTYLRNAPGMEPGTPVLFGGITVGKVSAVRPDQTDPTEIEIAFDVKQGTPINAKSIAAIGTVSLMSSPALAISTGSNDSPRLAPGAVVQSQETLSLDELQRKMGALADSAQSTLTAVGTDLNNLTGDGRQLLANLNDITGPVNRQHIAGVISNTDTMVADLSPKMKQISSQALKLTKDADALMAKMGPTIDNVNATVTNADQTITAFREPGQADLAEFQKTLAETRGLIRDLQVVVRANAQNTTYTIENLRMITDNLNDLTQSVKERPWSLVRIRQPKDREVPK
ncbi:MAG: MCE family protein [Acidobacteriaceae bacterium]|nr:MCE family protein [Acidobacteriaceae bacterium]